MGAISKMSFAMDTTFHHVKPEHNYRAPEVVPSKLLLNEQQRKELGDILRNKELILVRNWTIEQQTLAVYFLKGHKLLDHNPATSKWRIRETRTKNNTKRTLFQCTCGSVSTKHPATKGVGKSRQQYSFVGHLRRSKNGESHIPLMRTDVRECESPVPFFSHRDVRIAMLYLINDEGRNFFACSGGRARKF